MFVWDGEKLKDRRDIKDVCLLPVREDSYSGKWVRAYNPPPPRERGMQPSVYD